MNADRSTRATARMVRDALKRGVAMLRAAGVEEATLEAELLLRHALGLDKACFYLRLDQELSEERQQEFERLLAQRLAHRPTAYLTGHREFYGLDFFVGPGVLIPRPESEVLVDESLRAARARLDAGERQPIFVDVGTGSGAIAIAVAHTLPALAVYATDISPAALAIAQFNARRLRVAGRIRFLQGDLLDPLPEPADIIAANLPYIPSADVDLLPPELRDNEPRIALDGGEDGLTLIRRLLSQLSMHARPGCFVVLETAFNQAQTVAALAREVARGPVETRRDLAGNERAVVFTI